MLYEYGLTVLLACIIIISNFLYYSIYDFIFILDWCERYYIKGVDDRLSIVVFIMVYICFCFVHKDLYNWHLLNWFYIVSEIDVLGLEDIGYSQQMIENEINNALLGGISKIKALSGYLLNKLVYLTLISLISIIIGILA